MNNHKQPTPIALFNFFLIAVRKKFCNFARIFNQNIMKGIVNEHVSANFAYVTPNCFIMELSSEGVLCGSYFIGGGHHQGIDGDDEELLTNF